MRGEGCVRADKVIWVMDGTPSMSSMIFGEGAVAAAISHQDAVDK